MLYKSRKSDGGNLSTASIGHSSRCSLPSWFYAQSTIPSAMCVPNDIALSRATLLRWPGHLFCRQPQHGLDRGPPYGVHQIVNCHTRLHDQIHHRQELLAVFGEV